MIAKWSDGVTVDRPPPTQEEIAEALRQFPVEPGTVVTRLSDVDPEKVEWLWENRIPLGKLSGLEGDPGTGKTTLLLDLAARITSGQPMPDGSEAPSGGVLVLTAEDGLADTIRPRLDAMGADTTKVFSMAIQDMDGLEMGVTLPDNISAMRDVIEGHGIIFVILDPLYGFLSEKVDTHRDSPVRRALAPLAQLVEDTGVALEFIRHLTKSSDGKAIYRGGGSIAFTAAARSIMLAAENPDDPTQRILASVKNNLAPPQPSLAYYLDANLDGACRINWDGESHYSANQLCAQPTDPDERNAAHDLSGFLRDLLSDGARSFPDVKRDAREAGYAVSDKTLQRARLAIGAEYHRNGFRGETIWSLPSGAARPDIGAEPDPDDEARLAMREGA